MGNFTVTPEHLNTASKSFRDDVAPAYSDSSTQLQHGAHIDSPGFGIALSWLEAMYVQRVDYLVKDLKGAHDVVQQIADRLDQTAAEYKKGEDLNVKGFAGTPQHEQSFGSAFKQTLGADASGAVEGGLPAIVTLDAIYGAVISMGACSAMCPAFIPATVAAALLVANVPSIWDAHTALGDQSGQVKKINKWFENAGDLALDGWDGAGQLAFKDMISTISGHLDDVATYLDAMAGALVSIVFALAGFWGAIIVMIGPFLAWLIAMTLSEVLPWDIPVIESIKEAAGAAASAGITSTVAAVAAVGGLVAGLISAVLEKATELNLPDDGQSGVPDMTEFKVDQNYKTNLR